MLALNEHHYHKLIDMTALVRTREYAYEGAVETFSYNGCDIRVSQKGDSAENSSTSYGVSGYGFSIERKDGASREEARQLARRWADCFANPSYQLVGSLFNFERVCSAEIITRISTVKCRKFLRDRDIKALLKGEMDASNARETAKRWQRYYIGDSASTTLLQLELDFTAPPQPLISELQVEMAAVELKEGLRSIPDDIDKVVGYSESEGSWYWECNGQIPIFWFDTREEAVADYLQTVKRVAADRAMSR